MGKKKSVSKISKSHGHKKISHLHKIYKTKRKTKDHDQIHEDLKLGSAMALINQTVDHDEAGAAQHYCVHCARYFIDNHALTEHFRTKCHKRRMKALETEPYTQAEADRAAGLGSYVAPKKFVMKTQPTREKLQEMYGHELDKIKENVIKI